MGDASTPFNAPQRAGDTINLGVAAAEAIYAGVLVAVNAAGYAVQADDVAGLTVLGRAEEDALNGDGENADLTVNVRRGVFRYNNSVGNPVTIASLGQFAYIEDSTTVTVAAGPDNNIPAGLVVAIDDAGVWIDTRLNAHRVAPSHIPALGGQLTTVGGDAAEQLAVVGALADDIVVATVVDNAANNDVELIEAKPGEDTLDLLFTEDPGAGVKVAYVIFRAVG